MVTVRPCFSTSLVYLLRLGSATLVTKGVSYDKISIPMLSYALPSYTLKGTINVTHLETPHIFRGGITADFLPVDHVVAFLVEVTHCASPITLVESSLDLLGSEAQARHHWG